MFASPRSKRRKATSLTRQLAMLVVFFGLLLAPLGTNIATAYQADTAQRLAQDTGDETGDESGEFEDPNAGQEEQEEIPVAEPALLTLTSVVCPSDAPVDPMTSDANTLISTCAPGQATFDVSDSMGGYQTGYSNSPLTIPAGDVYITEQAFAAATEPVVACTSSFYGPFAPFTTSMGSTSLTLDPGDSVTCAWVSVEQAPMAIVTLNVWVCPANYDPKAPDVDATLDCTTPAPNEIEFSLADADPMTEDLKHKTGEPYAGMVTFERVPADVAFTLTETMPPADTATYGDPFIWDCSATDAMGTTQWESQNSAMPPPVATGATLQNLAFDADTTYVCEWFIVPTDDTASDDVPAEGEATEIPADTQVDGEPSDLLITKYTCAADFDPWSVDLGMLPASCAVGDDGITFDIAGPDNYTASSATGAASAGSGIAAPGLVAFEGLAPGTYTITETVPDGFVGAIVGCEGNATITQYSEAAPSAIIELAGGPVACKWVNLPTGDTSDVPAEVQADGEMTTLTITKYTCSATFSDISECQAGPDGIQFDMTDATGNAWNDTTGFSVPNAVAFSDLTSGSYTITEVVPDNIAAAGIWDCSGGATITQDSTNGPNAILDLTGGDAACNWVNIATDDLPPVDDTTPVDFAIKKYTCPADADVFNNDPDSAATGCQPTSGITFTLEGPDDASQTAVTGDPSAGTGIEVPGQAWFEGLEPGTYTITETVPEGFVGGITLCEGNVTIIQDSSVSPSAVLDIASGPASCDWVNFATEVDPPADIVITKYTCPAGYDTTADGANPLTDCSMGPDGITFTATGPNDYNAQSNTGDSMSNAVVFGGLEPGSYDIVETLPAGHTGFVWGCTDGASYLPYLDGPGVSIDISGSTVECDWLNIPIEPTDLIVYKYTCPVAYDAYGDGADPMMDCTAGPDGITFNAEGPNGYNAQTNTGDSIQYAVMFGGLEPGDYIVTETMPPGTTGMPWSCTDGTSWSAATENIPSMLVSVTSGTVECVWLNIPTDGTITINKMLCAEGYTPTLTDSGVEATDCATPLNGITFTASPGNAGITDANGQVILTVPFEQDIVVTETVPPGYGTPVFLCDYAAPNGGGLMQQPGEGESFTISALTPGTAVTCTVYNYITPPTDLIVYKWACPEGYDPSANGADPSLDCEAGPNGVVFSAIGPNGYYAQSQTGDSIPNAVMFGGLGVGDYIVSEVVPEGYIGVPWSCTDGTNWSAATEGVPSMLVSVTGGTVECDWLNIATYQHEVTVYKWVCPEGLDTTDRNYGWFSANCTVSTDDIQFRADHVAGSEYAYPAGGVVFWKPVPAGPIGIQEYMPDDYKNPAVFCSVNDGPTQQFDASGGYVYLEDFGSEPDRSNTFVCHWFNIPGGPGEITVYKWTCAPNYDPYAYGVDPYNDCKPGPNSVTFTATGPDGYNKQAKTGTVKSTAQWTDLVPGNYTITETLPKDTASVFVWDCYGQRSGALRPTPLTVQPTVTVKVQAGDEVTCHWFNVPTDPYGSLTVVKYECNTVKFVSEVDCHTYEAGQTFHLEQFNGKSWDVLTTATTGKNGRYTWYGLDPGKYWVVEQGRNWCHMTSEQLEKNGQALNVKAGAETVVKVYNCTTTPGKQPNKPPTKYPNTGMPPVVTRDDWRWTA